MIALRWHVLRLPLLLSLLWCLLLFALFQWTVQREDENATELAQIQTRTLFSSIVNTRGWNADRGGVWATEQPNCQPNPWLPEDQRTLLTADGRRLVRFNPAYMTRQIAERFQSKTMNFHICGLSPKRPQNRPDQWETSALLDFDAGKTERFQLVPGRRGAYYRYMAPLRAEESCLQCHQRNKIGDVLGGISVSISAFPILASVEQRNSMVGLTFGLIGFIGVLGIGGATFQINRKKEQAEEANQAKSVFLSRMSHDIRTPMSAIIGLTAIAKKNAGDPERLNECIDKIALASQFQLSLVNDILDVSKIESGKMQLASEPFDLAGIIDDVTLFTSSSATAKGIVFETSVDPRVGRMYVGDPMRLKQILMNLLSNALKFVDENGKVTLRVESLRRTGRQEAVRFIVSDNGIGMSNAFQKRMFLPFEQDAAPRRKRSGSGLGLAIIGNLTALMGGSIAVDSEQGKGTRFTVDIPLERTETAEKHDTAGENAEERCRFRGETLLLAEDDGLNAEVLENLLGYINLRVVHAENGKVAVDLFERSAPGEYAAILMDIQMPIMDGLDAARTIRALPREDAASIPIFALSASVFAEDVERSLCSGMNGHLGKPVDIDQICSMLQTWLYPQQTDTQEQA